MTPPMLDKTPALALVGTAERLERKHGKLLVPSMLPRLAYRPELPALQPAIAIHYAHEEGCAPAGIASGQIDWLRPSGDNGS